MKINEKIRIFRKRANLSQQDMADKLDISVNFYGQLERGDKPPHLCLFPYLKRIVDILDIDLEQLKSDVEDCDDRSMNNQIDIVMGKYEGMSFSEMWDLMSKEDSIENDEDSENTEDLTKIQNENQRLQLIIEHKNELLERQKQEIELLKEMIHLLKQQNAK